MVPCKSEQSFSQLFVEFACSCQLLHRNPIVIRTKSKSLGNRSECINCLPSKNICLSLLLSKPVACGYHPTGKYEFYFL